MRIGHPRTKRLPFLGETAVSEWLSADNPHNNLQPTSPSIRPVGRTSRYHRKLPICPFWPRSYDSAVQNASPEKGDLYLGELAVEHVRSREIKENCIAKPFTSEAYLARPGTRNCRFYPDMLLLSGDTRKKVTFPGSTTRTKVTFDPEKGDLPCANSREKVTMHPEKGDFFRPHCAMRNYPAKGGLFPLFSELLPGKLYIYRSNNLPRRKVAFRPVFSRNKY